MEATGKGEAQVILLTSHFISQVSDAIDFKKGVRVLLGDIGGTNARYLLKEIYEDRSLNKTIKEKIYEV